MQLSILLVIITVAGAAGGFGNCLIAKEFVPMGRDRDSGVWRPGWLGNVIVGSLAALVVWCAYGPLAAYDVFAGTSVELHLTFFQIGSSIIVGIGGGSLLTKIAQTQADSVAKGLLADALVSASTKPGTGEKNFLGVVKDARTKELAVLVQKLNRSNGFEAASVAARISRLVKDEDGKM